jgi:ATP-binding cassette, subfamily C, bacterial PrsD
VLYLTGPLFMMEVYDRVIPSRSIPTLVGLVAVVGLLFAFQGFMDFIRGRMFSRIGAALDERLRQRVFNALVRLPLNSRSSGDGLQPLRDLDQVRSFLSGGGPLALFDLPLDAALSCDLLSVSFPDRHGGAARGSAVARMFS